ncbi:MAG: iron-containing alcohol dehydrogenase [Gordonibacter pamelaeae]
MVALLKECGKTVVDDGGVMPNPTAERLLEGRDRAREKGVDFILAVGGGSVADYAKAVKRFGALRRGSVERYYLRFEEVECDVVPVGCVLTMAGTGSEINGGAVITNRGQKLQDRARVSAPRRIPSSPNP